MSRFGAAESHTAKQPSLLVPNWKSLIEHPQLSSPDRRIDLSTIPPQFSELLASMKQEVQAGKDLIVLGLKGAGPEEVDLGVLTFLLQGVSIDPSFSDYKICLPERYWEAAGRKYLGYACTLDLGKNDETLESFSDEVRAFTQSHSGAAMPGKRIVLFPSAGSFKNEEEKNEFKDRIQRAYADDRRALRLIEVSKMGSQYEALVAESLSNASIEGVASLILRACEAPRVLGESRTGGWDEEEIMGVAYWTSMHERNMAEYGQRYTDLLRLFQVSVWCPYPLHVMLEGPHGTGKTTLLKSLAQTAIAIGAGCDYSSLYRDEEGVKINRVVIPSRFRDHHPAFQHFTFVDQIDLLSELIGDEKEYLNPRTMTWPGRNIEHILPRRGHLFATSNLTAEEFYDAYPEPDDDWDSPPTINVGWNAVSVYRSLNTADPDWKTAAWMGGALGGERIDIRWDHRWNNDQGLAEL